MNSNAAPDSKQNSVGGVGAFLNFYDECFNEAYTKAEQKYIWGDRCRYPDSYTSTDKINSQIETLNKAFDSILEEMSPKLHQYFRTHGIPEVLGGEPVKYFKICEDSDDSVPFNGKPVYIPFQFWASTCKYKVDRYFTDYVEEYNGVVLKMNQRMSSYKPPMNDHYDSEFSALREKEESLKEKIKYCKYHLPETQNVLAELEKKRSSNALDTLISFLFIPVIAAVAAAGVLLVLSLISNFILGIEIGFMPLFGKIIVGLIVGAVFLGILIMCWKDIIVMAFIEEPKARQKAKDDVKQAELDIVSTEKELADLIESDTYRRAKENNLLAYERDCQFANEWQSQWFTYNSIVVTRYVIE